jgi:TetR/AcrR family tetracycline transcriptional repressor
MSDLLGCEADRSGRLTALGSVETIAPNAVRVKSREGRGSTVPTPRKRSVPLSRDELFERALAVVDAEGLDALTMRRLAREVGVEAASLYHHVPDKEALLNGMLTRVRSEVRLPQPMPEDLFELMAVIFGEYRRVLTAHPHLVRFAGRRVEGDPDSGLIALISTGLSEDDAVDLWQSVMAFVVGFSMFGSEHAETAVDDLPPGLARRMADWRDDTFARTLGTILDEYRPGRVDAYRPGRVDGDPPR